MPVKDLEGCPIAEKIWQILGVATHQFIYIYVVTNMYRVVYHL